MALLLGMGGVQSHRNIINLTKVSLCRAEMCRDGKMLWKWQIRCCHV